MSVAFVGSNNMNLSGATSRSNIGCSGISSYRTMAESHPHKDRYPTFSDDREQKKCEFVLVLHHKDDTEEAIKFKKCMTKEINDVRKIPVIAMLYHESYAQIHSMEKAFLMSTCVYVFLTKTFIKRFSMIVLTQFLRKYSDKTWHVVPVYDDTFANTFDIPKILATFPRTDYSIFYGIRDKASLMKGKSDIQINPRKNMRHTLKTPDVLKREMEKLRMQRFSMKLNNVIPKAKIDLQKDFRYRHKARVSEFFEGKDSYSGRLFS